jgi:hypothetical protein
MMIKSKLLAIAVVLMPFVSTATATGTTQAVDWSRAEADVNDAESRLGTEMNKNLHPALAPAVQDALNDYYIISLKHRAAVFAWQAFASKLIFWMVAVLVFSGLLFSALQFYHGLRAKSADATQEIELSLQSVKVKSQFLGVVTLALSLAFFYLYVANIYPIVPVGAAQTTTHGK